VSELNLSATEYDARTTTTKKRKRAPLAPGSGTTSAAQVGLIHNVNKYNGATEMQMVTKR